jgi:diketogulonate reductase-like aldo/keto reductase
MNHDPGAPLTRRRMLALTATASGALLLRAKSDGAMRSRPIPSTGEQLPIIGLGTWQTFDVADAGPLRPILARFAARGGKLVDSSPMYGRSEDVTGTVAERAKLRPSLFLATKVWTSGRAAGIAQMEHSFAALRTRQIDLLQVHNLVDVETHLPLLREMKEARRIRYIGITHYDAGAYARVEQLLHRERLDFLQINYSLAEPQAEARLLPLALEKGVAVIVNRPFAEGALFRVVRGKALPAWAAELGCTSWAQLFLKWIVSHPAVTAAIPATADPRHLDDNLSAGFGSMPDATMRKRIAEALR